MAEYVKDRDSFKYVVVNNKNQYLIQFPSLENYMLGEWDMDILRAIRMNNIHAHHTAKRLANANAIRVLVDTIVRVTEYNPNNL